MGPSSLLRTIPRMTSAILLNRLRPLLLGAVLVSLAACGGAQARRDRHMAKGEAFMADGNFVKARLEFQNALQIAPTDAEARYENGVVAEKLGKPEDASQFYLGALDVAPDHLGARTRLARLYVFAAAPDRALALIAPALDKHPDDSELLTVRAAARVQTKDSAGALVDAERAVALSPTNEDAVAVLAGLYTAAHDSTKSQALLERSILSMPNTIDLRLLLAQQYAVENDNAHAESLLVDLVRLKPTDKAHRIRLAQFYVRNAQLDAGEKTLRDGLKALPGESDLKQALIEFLTTRRSPDVAERELQQMIAADPKDVDNKFALAKFYESNKQPEQAETVYRGIISAENLDAAGLNARDRLAALLMHRADIAGASNLISEVLAKSPRDDDALYMRGDIALSKQDARSAISDLRAVLRDQPNSVGVLRSLARAHLANGEPAIAEETLRAAAEANPKNVSLRLQFVQLLADLGKIDQARPILADLVNAHPDNTEALELQFRIAMAAKDASTAKAAANALVAIRPRAAVGYLYQGMVAELEKNIPEAVRDYAVAVESQPDALEPLEAETRVLMAAKRGDEALKRLDEFTAKYPGNPLGPDAKGELLLRAGKFAQARDSFQVAIARAPRWWIPYRDLAAAQLGMKDVDAAIDILRKAAAVVDQPDAIGIELASTLQRAGRNNDAMSAYEAVLKHNPAADVAANNLAMLITVSKTDQQSLDRAKALTVRFADSANPSFLDTYGWVLYKRGEAAASVPVLERVVAKAPDQAVAHYHLGMAQSLLGNSPDAVRNLTFAVNSGTNFSGLDEARTTLARLGRAPATAAATPRS